MILNSFPAAEDLHAIYFSPVHLMEQIATGLAMLEARFGARSRSQPATTAAERAEAGRLRAALAGAVVTEGKTNIAARIDAAVNGVLAEVYGAPHCSRLLQLLC
jgi:hypothetical protein